MAFTGITASEAIIDQKAGANASSSFTDTMKTASLLQAESWLNIETLHNYSDEFLTLDADTKSIVTMVTASLVAMDMINYDLLAIGSRTAETRLDVLDEIVNRGLRTLTNTSKQRFASGVS